MKDYAHIEQRIVELLGWTEEQYSQYLYESGLQYLDALLHGLPHERDLAERSRVFWDWFKRLWYELDYQIIICGAAIDEGLYRCIHYPEALLLEYTPNELVWESILKPLNTKQCEKI